MDSGNEAITLEEAAPAPAGMGLGRVLLVAAIGCLLVGFAGFAASTVVHSDEPVVRSMCVDSTCTYAMAAGDTTPGAPAPAPKRRSAPERLVRGVLYFCHIR